MTCKTQGISCHRHGVAPSPLGSADYIAAPAPNASPNLDTDLELEPFSEDVLVPSLLGRSRQPSESRSLADLREDVFSTWIASSSSPSPLPGAFRRFLAFLFDLRPLVCMV